MTGRDLAINQAADAFELFTGLKPSIVEMGNAFDGVMAKRYSATTRSLTRRASTRPRSKDQENRGSK